MTSAPARFVEYLRQEGYHPRSSAHGKALCDLVLRDLLDHCPRIREHAETGQLVFDVQRKIIVGASEWNIDLVLGSPSPGAYLVRAPLGIAQSPPTAIRIAIEAKTVMTEHGKARRNRQRDLDSFHQFVHRYDEHTVAAGLTVVNIADRFKSPLRPAPSIHRNIQRLVEGTIELLRALPVRSVVQESASGLEANAVLLIHHDNIDPTRTQLVTGAPAPAVGDPIHYDTFVRRICDRYAQRWA